MIKNLELVRINFGGSGESKEFKGGKDVTISNECLIQRKVLAVQ